MELLDDGFFSLELSTSGRPGGAVGMVVSYDPLTDAGGGSNPRWSTGKAQD